MRTMDDESLKNNVLILVTLRFHYSRTRLLNSILADHRLKIAVYTYLCLSEMRSAINVQLFWPQGSNFYIFLYIKLCISVVQ